MGVPDPPDLDHVVVRAPPPPRTCGSAPGSRGALRVEVVPRPVQVHRDQVDAAASRTPGGTPGAARGAPSSRCRTARSSPPGSPTHRSSSRNGTGRELGVGAHRPDAHELLEPRRRACSISSAPIMQVVVEERSRGPLVRSDPSDASGEMDHDVRARILVHRPDPLLRRQVVVAAPGDEDGGAGRLETFHDLGAEEAGLLPGPRRSSPTRRHRRDRIVAGLGHGCGRAPVGNGTLEPRRGELRVDHRADQLLEAHLRLPSELRPRLRRIPDEDRRIDRAEVARVLANVAAPSRDRRS